MVKVDVMEWDEWADGGSRFQQRDWMKIRGQGMGNRMRECAEADWNYGLSCLFVE